MATLPLAWKLRRVLAANLIGLAALGGMIGIGGLSGCGSGATPSSAANAASTASPVTNADGKKVVRLEFRADITGFDPAAAPDLYSAIVIDGVFDTLLTYDYLAEPSKLVPKITDGMPEVSDGGKLYTVKLKKGVYFSPHEVFGGKKRELVAQDVVYSYMRHYDDRIKPVWRFLIDQKIVGINAWYDAGKAAKKLDFDAKIPGLEVVDSHTLKIRLTRPDYNFGYVMAHPATAIVAREVIEKYPDDAHSHPVGTSAYALKEWVRGQRIVFEKNPNWRGGTWDFKPSGRDPYDDTIVKQMQGKPLASVDRVEVYPIVESQTRLLAFKDSQLDVMLAQDSNAKESLTPDNKLIPEFVNRGVRLQRFIDPEYTYVYYNWQDPVWGGPELHKIALRRAVSMAYNMDDEIKVIRKNQAIGAEYLVPPGVVGHKPDFVSNMKYNPALANALLDKFGYKKSADGYRNTPEGKPFSFKYSSTAASTEREFDELFKKNLDVIGVRFETHKEQFAELKKLEKRCLLQIHGAAWIADYPDGDNFLQLLYGKNVGESNNACYKSAAFDKLYEQAAVLPDGPERDALYFEMQKQFEADTPWRLGVSRYRNQLIYPWVVGYKKHPILLAEWMYFDINTGKGK
jgi:oligopeptide transport system substrate-binding protein